VSAKGFHIGLLGRFPSGLEGFSSFRPGASEEFGKTFFFQKQIDGFVRDLFSLSEKGFPDFIDRVVSFPEVDDSIFELDGRLTGCLGTLF